MHDVQEGGHATSQEELSLLTNIEWILLAQMLLSPKTIGDVRKLLGLLEYHLKYVQDFVGDVVAQWLVRRTWDQKVESSSPGRCNHVVPQCLSSSPRCINGNQQNF